MELTYPLIIYIGIGVLALAFLVTMFAIRKYEGGIKSANGSFIKKFKRYRSLVIRYWFIKFIMITALMASIVLSFFLATRPTRVRTITNETHNRDIFICFDVSTSLDGINLEMCEMLKDFVKDLKGERFGITMFNGRSVLVCPLTTDYNYVLTMLDTLEESIRAGEDVWYYSDVDDMEAYGYRFSGTLSDYGSSMIGDGLATCLYDFPDLDKEPDRSRMIVFVTDNDLLGDPIVTIEEACELCKNRGVKVFALAPEFVVDEGLFKKAVESTGGGYYNTRDKKAMKKMMNDVTETDVNVSYKSFTTIVDVPEISIIALISCVCVYFVCARRIRL